MDFGSIAVFLKKVFKILWSLWQKLPEETKKAIIERVQQHWKVILEKFYDKVVQK